MASTPATPPTGRRRIGPRRLTHFQVAILAMLPTAVFCRFGFGLDRPATAVFCLLAATVAVLTHIWNDGVVQQ